MPTLKLATFNVNNVNAHLSNVLAWLARESPDVVCLQELKATNEQYPEAALQKAGYESVWHGERLWNGVAILARGVKPKEIRRALPGQESDTMSRYLEADLGGLVVGCLYLPNGNPIKGPKFQYKLAWMDCLVAHAESLYSSETPVVLAGDYNVVPTDFDVYDPKSWRKDALLQPETRERWQKLLDQGWVDSLRAKHPDEKIFTFWDFFRKHWERDAGLRIDHLLLNEVLAPTLVDAGVDRWVRGEPKPSDHAPTWVTLDLSKAGSKPSRSRSHAAKK
jgi:exodeoxyribonuclease III